MQFLLIDAANNFISNLMAWCLFRGSENTDLGPNSRPEHLNVHSMEVPHDTHIILKTWHLVFVMQYSTVIY